MLCESLIFVSSLFIYLNIATGLEPLVKTGERKLSFHPPELTEEESKSRFVPQSFKCDACKAIAYQFYTLFDDFNRLHKKYKFDIPESDLLDLTEGICHHDTYQFYGVKEINGENKLSGDGLQAKDTPGILAGGGMWPGRLATMCSSIIEDSSEEEIYRGYKEQPDDLYHLQKFICFGSGRRGSCKISKNNKEL